MLARLVLPLVALAPSIVTAARADVVTFHRLGSAIVGSDGSTTRRLGSETIYAPPTGSIAPRVICRPFGSSQRCEDRR